MRNIVINIRKYYIFVHLSTHVSYTPYRLPSASLRIMFAPCGDYFVSWTAITCSASGRKTATNSQSIAMATCGADVMGLSSSAYITSANLARLSPTAYVVQLRHQQHECIPHISLRDASWVTPDGVDPDYFPKWTTPCSCLTPKK
jgi:hypothetical protein